MVQCSFPGSKSEMGESSMGETRSQSWVFLSGYVVYKRLCLLDMTIRIFCRGSSFSQYIMMAVREVFSWLVNCSLIATCCRETKGTSAHTGHYVFFSPRDQYGTATVKELLPCVCVLILRYVSRYGWNDRRNFIAFRNSFQKFPTLSWCLTYWFSYDPPVLCLQGSARCAMIDCLWDQVTRNHSFFQKQILNVFEYRKWVLI